MGRTTRKFQPAFKLQIVREVEAGDRPISQICREHSLSDSIVRRWLQQYQEKGPAAFHKGDPKSEELEAAHQRIAQLESALGRSTMEVDFLRRCVKRANVPLAESARW